MPEKGGDFLDPGFGRLRAGMIGVQDGDLGQLEPLAPFKFGSIFLVVGVDLVLGKNDFTADLTTDQPETQNLILQPRAQVLLLHPLPGQGGGEFLRAFHPLIVLNPADGLVDFFLADLQVELPDLGSQ